MFLKNAHQEGIPIARYGLNNIEKLASSSEFNDLAKLEVILTEKFLLYSQDLSIGIVDPLSLSSFIDIKREIPPSENFLNNLNYFLNINNYFENLRPNNPDYLKLMKELANLKEIKSKIKITSVPNDITLEVGMSHPNVIPLRQRLFELNIHQDTSNSETFDKELLKSVMLFQEYSGLDSDGVVGKKLTKHLIYLLIQN